MNTANQQATITSTAETARREQSRKRQVGAIQRATASLDTTTCARTRAQVAAAAIRSAPPFMGTWSQSRPSGIPPPLSRTGLALAVKQKQQYQRGFTRLTRKVSRMENEIHQAMADNDAGKLLNYRQLMRSNKHKEAWGLPSANKFGQSAQGN